MRQVHVTAAPADHADGILEQRHHAQSEKIHLDDTHGGAVVLVPLHDRAPGHGRRLEGDAAVEPALADDHAARVLAEVPGQILDGRPEIGEVTHDRLRGIAAGLPKMREETIAGILVLPVADERGQTIAQRGGKPQHLAHFSRRAPAAIGDDIGGHGRAQAPIALVDVLDDLLAPVAARQIEIDVRPFAALLGEKALEEELHPHRIHRGDTEGIADRAVGGRAPSLHQDAVATAELDQVPDDEKVAGQIEAGDQVELALDLPPCLLGQRARAVALPRPFLAERAEPADRRLTRRQRVVWEAIAQVLEGEAEPQRQLARVGHGRRAIGKEPFHLAAGLEKALAVAREQSPGPVDRRAVLDAGQRVQQWAISAGGHEGGIAGEKGQSQPLGFGTQPFIARLLLAGEIALELGVDAEATEEAGEPVERRAGGLMSAVGEGRGDGPGGAAGETDEPAHMLFEIVPARGTLAFGRAHLDARQQAAEILVPFLVFHEEGQPAAVDQADLGADQRRDAKTRAGAVEGRRSVHTVGVNEGQGRLLEGDGASRQRLGQRRRLEERKCALGMQLDEHGRASPSPCPLPPWGRGKEGALSHLPLPFGERAG